MRRMIFAAALLASTHANAQWIPAQCNEDDVAAWFAKHDSLYGFPPHVPSPNTATIGQIREYCKVSEYRAEHPGLCSDIDAGKAP